MAKKYTVNAVIEIKGVKHYPGEVLSLDGKFEEEVKANQLIPLSPEKPQENGGKGEETHAPDNPPKGEPEGGEGKESHDNGEAGEDGEKDKEPEKTGYTAEEIAEAAKKIG